MPYLSYDSRNMLLKSTQINKIESRLKKADLKLSKLKNQKEQGFFDLPYDSKKLKTIEILAKETRKTFENLVVIGIGGSELGSKTIIKALDSGKGMKVTFLSNPDPDTITETIARINWKKTAVNVISKSGKTLETMSIFMTIRCILIKAVGKKKHAQHIIVTTDLTNSVLCTLAKKENYQILPHPLNVGGRFSVLSIVGLFPAACAGIDIRGLAKGAKTIETARKKLGTKCEPAKFAALHYLHLTKYNRPIHVLMPYSDRLSDLSMWYRQIWAESLGKKKGKTFVGPTPIAALGTIDQHSQIQLYNNGPIDKVITFIEVKKFKTKISVPKIWTQIDGIKYIGGLDFETIIHAEREGTAKALTNNKRPNGTLHIPRISPETIGALFMFYELATAYVGELMGINAFDQPGVEEGKLATQKLLSKKA